MPYTTSNRIIVIGAGHNGLTCACYLARAGLDVIVLEGADRIGGAVHTAATIPGMPEYRFDTCSVVHNMINMTSVLDELDLAGVGLQYVETDPFTTSFFPDGSSVRLFRSVERTCTELARISPRDADAYAHFMRVATPAVEAGLGIFRESADGGGGVREWARRGWYALQAALRENPFQLARKLVGPYGPLLEELFETEHARAGFAALAAHGTLGPHTPGAAFFIFWQAAYHRYGNWHAIGGSGALAEALRRRLEAWGGVIRTQAPVAKIIADGRVRGVELADGERLEADAVVAAINPQTALLELLGAEKLRPQLRARLRSRHRSNAVQFVVHAALNRLPPWPGALGDVYHGMQSVGASVGQIAQNFREAEAGIAPRDPAAYAFTLSALDPTLAPPGKHTAYIACASYPARFADGGTWAERGEGEAHRLLAAIEARAFGFTASVAGLAWRHADDWARETGLLGGHPMHLDMSLDQLGLFRPLLELAGHRAPVPGLYLSGAGTAPTGGVSAVPGRAAARAVLKDWRRK